MPVRKVLAVIAVITAIVAIAIGSAGCTPGFVDSHCGAITQFSVAFADPHPEGC